MNIEQTIDKKIQNIPALRFKEFEGEWEKKNLEQFLNFKNGINAAKEQYGSGYKFINVLDIINNDFITHDRIIGMVNVDENTFKKSEVAYGDIVFQRSSETREEVGQSNVYLDKKQTSTFGGFIIRGKKISDYVPFYMNCLLKTSKVRKEITSRAGGSTRYNVGQEVLKKVPIYITQYKEEQQKIASFLTAIDQKINQLSQKVALQEQYKKGVMQKIFSQELRFKDDDGNDFADWEVKKITEIAKTSIGLVTSMTKHYVSNGIPLIRNSDIKQNRIRKNNLINLETGFAKENEHRKLRINDIVTVHTGDIGVSAIIDEEMDGCLGFATLNTRIIKKELVVSEYLCWYYNSINNMKYAISMATGDGRSNYNLKDFNKAKIPLPHIKEQQKIANFLSQLDEQIAQTQEQLAHLQDYKKGLLQQLFV